MEPGTMPTMTDTVIGGGLAGTLVVAVKELLVKIFMRNGRELATKSWTGEHMDKIKVEVKEDMKDYAAISGVQVLLLTQKTGCLGEWHKIKDEIVSSVHAESEAQRREIKADIEGIHSRLDKFIQSRA